MVCLYLDCWMCLLRVVNRFLIVGGGCDEVEFFGFFFDLGVMVDFFVEMIMEIGVREGFFVFFFFLINS